MSTVKCLSVRLVRALIYLTIEYVGYANDHEIQETGWIEDKLRATITETCPHLFGPNATPKLDLEIRKMITPSSSQSAKETPLPSRSTSSIENLRANMIQVIECWERENDEERLGETLSTYACYVVVVVEKNPSTSNSGDTVNTSQKAASTSPRESDREWSLSYRRRGDITYALHQRQMPVLVVQLSPPAPSPCASTSCATRLGETAPCKDVVPRPHHPQHSSSDMAYTAEENYLFYSHQIHEESAEEALNRFWKPLSLLIPIPSSPVSPLPMEKPELGGCALHPAGRLMALEHDEFVFPPAEWSNQIRRYLLELQKQLQSSEAGEVVFLCSRGYPVRQEDLEVALTDEDDLTGDLGSKPETLKRLDKSMGWGLNGRSRNHFLLPSPPTPLDPLLEKLLKFHISTDQENFSSSIKAIEDGVLSQDLISYHPMLHAEVFTYQRYRSFHLLRHLYFFRGSYVVLLGHLTSAAVGVSHWLTQRELKLKLSPCLSGSFTSEEDEDDRINSLLPEQKSQIRKDLQKLLSDHFSLEHTYLDFPVPERTVVLQTKLEYNNRIPSPAEQYHWLSLLIEESGNVVCTNAGGEKVSPCAGGQTQSKQIFPWIPEVVLAEGNIQRPECARKVAELFCSPCAC